ncbi:hypothetical protein [Collimonas fungivorans]|uniref:hypothetical protein n=1 Tax=Collimonas fungivorans TaxID=158899 RepID=UPI003FA3AFF6
MKSTNYAIALSILCAIFGCNKNAASIDESSSTVHATTPTDSNGYLIAPSSPASQPIESSNGNEPAKWYSANADVSDCHEIDINPGELIDHYRENGDKVWTKDSRIDGTGAIYKVEVKSTNDGGLTVKTNLFFRSKELCIRERVAPMRAMADKYK